MTLTQFFIHFLLLAVGKEEGCRLETSDSETVLLDRLAANDAVFWSPQTDDQSIQALANLLEISKGQTTDSMRFFTHESSAASRIS